MQQLQGQNVKVKPQGSSLLLNLKAWLKKLLHIGNK